MTATLGLVNNVGINLLAFLAPGFEGSAAEGRAAGAVGIRLIEKGLDLVEAHLLRFGEDKANAAMVERLRSAMEAGRRATGADANFYLHELAEASMTNRGMSYDAAHVAALEKYGVSQYSVYHPEVITADRSMFGDVLARFWGIP
jgi:filamentous hemagglutinin